MFGRMMITPIAQVGADADLQAAVSSLLQAAEEAEMVRWIEFPHSVLVFLLVPGDPESGAVYSCGRFERSLDEVASNIVAVGQPLTTMHQLRNFLDADLNRPRCGGRIRVMCRRSR